jgi:NTP pyrophosphatase (non-canonical NTP hydrolase)
MGIKLANFMIQKISQKSGAPLLIDISGLSEALSIFASERNWDQYHSPKNLAMALTGEVGELSEIFQWLTEDASKSVATNPDTATAVRDELADVTLYLVRLASVLGVDLNEAVSQKLQKNAAKYPVDKSHGSHKKYDKL